jgi:hypothetical protein
MAAVVVNEMGTPGHADRTARRAAAQDAGARVSAPDGS